jgi:hypothetical protein
MARKVLSVMVAVAALILLAVPAAAKKPPGQGLGDGPNKGVFSTSLRPTHSFVESDGVSFAVTRSSSRGEARVTVTPSVGSGTPTATAPDDFDSSAIPVFFARGVVTVKVVVPVVNDSVAEGDETFRVDLTDPSVGYTLATSSGGEIVIVNDDGLPSATVTPDPDVIETATIGVPVSRSYTVVNAADAFTGRAAGTTLGSAVIARPTIAELTQDVRYVDVTQGTTSLRATTGNTSDTAADLDLFVFDCSSGTCALAGQSAGAGSAESVTIDNPAPGQWKVVVDAFSIPSGSTAYDYVDVFINPALGSVQITDANALRPAGSSWTVPGSVTANAAPATGRVLLGQVVVVTDANVRVASGDVIIRSAVS